MAPRVVDPLVKADLGKAELRRRKRALMGSKTGLLLAMLHGELSKKRELIQRGRVSLGVSPQELHQLLTEIIVVLVQVRDAYVDERCPKEG